MHFSFWSVYYEKEAKKAKHMPRPDESSGNTALEDMQWPSHARKIKKTTASLESSIKFDFIVRMVHIWCMFLLLWLKLAGKKGGHGTMKALVAMAKRLKLLHSTCTEKLKIEFLENCRGPCGDNSCIFMDEIVWMTRLYAPLIRVKYWKHIDPEVKKMIAESILVYTWMAHIL